MPNPAYEELFRLPIEARMDLVYDLLESMEDKAEQEEIPSWQLEELDRREARALANPGQGRDWKDVKASIRARHATE